MLIKTAMRSLIILFIVGISTVGPTHLIAQNPELNGSAAIFQQLQKLQVLGSVLYIAAHPDDENNSLLPYLAKEKKYRTAYLSLTRGDGGQNLIGPEQGVELGLIRTQELLAARQIDGSEQYFTSAYEFGFSKTASETLQYWDRKKVLADMVWVIRKFQPDIIVNRFPPDARAGHGHHASSAVLSIEAFKAAADPNQFPEQLSKGVKVWQAKRLLWNTFNFGGANTTSENQLKIDVGVFNPFLGQSYGEVGGEARSMHKSQGEGRPRRKGPVFEYFATIAGDTAKYNLMDGIVTDWGRIPVGGKTVEELIKKIITQFDFIQPAQSINDLTKLYQQVQSLSYDGVWKAQKLHEIETLIIACAGIVVEATTETEYAVPGEKLGIQFLVNKRSTVPIILDKIQLNTTDHSTFDTSINIQLQNNINYTLNYVSLVSIDQPYSQPYWLSAPMKDMGTFDVSDYELIGRANSKPPFTAKLNFIINGVGTTINVPIQYKFVDLVRGEIFQPLNVIPRVVISMDKNVLLKNIKTPGKKDISNTNLLLQVKSNFNATNLPVTISLKEGEKYLFSKDTVMNLTTGSIYSYFIDLGAALGKQNPANIHAELKFQLNGKVYAYDQMLKTIKYDHIPSINYLFKDQARIINEPIVSIPKKVGYIVGAGDKVPEALSQLGHKVDILQESDIVEAKLASYDVIVVGIRAYNIHEWLTNKNEIINRYIEQGGHLIVQYLKSNLVGNKRVKVGPYEFAMSNIRVTEEKAPVQLLQAQHPFLNSPNKIDEKDFDNWVQERSTYQMEPVKAPYEAILQMNDTNDKPTNGSLVTSKYGKGNFTYVSLVLFRQLPAGVAGSYKLLANLVSLPPNK
ncbi:PIG-L family deacetylase [Sediminibacterium sp.]|uniref:PIG-L family deacetylase n=1 Tax=Sediminibacterium sp. TaxID=1917865 RepID=UPI003F716C13